MNSLFIQLIARDEAQSLQPSLSLNYYFINFNPRPFLTPKAQLYMCIWNSILTLYDFHATKEKCTDEDMITIIYIRVNWM